MKLCPAHELEGLKLSNGWEVTSKIEKDPSSTGGNFSVCYVVTHENGKKAFMKALDYNPAIQSPDVPASLAHMTTSYIFEKDILEECSKSKMTRVVLAIDSGNVKADGYFMGADYLIFEIASGDVRKFMSFSKEFDLAFSLRSLHNIAVGLSQLHNNKIAHQDLKPSNVLVFDDQSSKIADMGRASKLGKSSPHEDLLIAGDLGYAPIDMVYGNVDTDWNVRRAGCDMYLFGSTLMYYFTQLSMTTSIVGNLSREFHPCEWRGKYSEILPYVYEAYYKVLDDFKKSILPEFADELTEMLGYLCEPNIARRGHPQNLRGYESQFSFERVISKLEMLSKRAEIHMKRNGL